MSFADHPVYVFVFRRGNGDSEVSAIEPESAYPNTRESAIQAFRAKFGDTAEIRRIVEHRVINGVKQMREVTEEDS